VKQQYCEIKLWARGELSTLAVNTDHVSLRECRYVCLLHRHDDVFVRIPRDVVHATIVELGGDLFRQLVNVVWGALSRHEQQQITPPWLTEEVI